MASGTRKDFELHRGDGKTLTFTVVDENGVGLDLTSMDLEWNFSKRRDDASEPLGAAILSPGKTVGAGITLTDIMNGVGEITLLSTDTVGQRATVTYYHEMQVTEGSEPSTVLFGDMKLILELIPPGA
jgi:hypothetical protein